VADPTPLSARVDDIRADQRIFSRLLGLLSALAVTLAAVGLYGVVAFGVAARRRELGVRLALGARGRDVAWVVLRHAASIVAAGVVLGLGGAWGLSRVLENRLFGVAPVDPASYTAAALLFATVAGLACWAPARRAMRVDPVVTLREE
jgi:putative ABC transport system permease protein